MDYFGIKKENLFQGTYDGWRKTRIKKIEALFEKCFFMDKTILELGCGYGHIGKYFSEELGSKVTFAEGNSSFIEFIQKNNPNSEVILLDQDKPWNLERKFDIIIHWGVLYHLENWKEDLINAMKHSDLIFLESEVGNSSDENYELKFEDHDGYDQAINKKATRPSASYIENVIKQNGFSFERYDDSSINYSSHRYDWVVTNSPEKKEEHGRRRFWILKKL